MRTTVLTTISLFALLLSACSSEVSQPAAKNIAPAKNPPAQQASGETTATNALGYPIKPQDVAPLGVGDNAPAATLPRADGTQVDLAEVYTEGPTMLIFYRGSWCPFCTAHLADVARVEPELRAKGVRVMAISPDEPATGERLAASMDLRYTLLADTNFEMIGAFGLAFGDEKRMLPVPAVYLVDKAGVIRFAHWQPDFKRRMSGEELLAAVDAMDKSAGPQVAAVPPIPQKAEDVSPLKVGDAAPTLTLGSPEGTPVDLGELYGEGPTMLIFYRGSWCPYCTRHLAEVAKREAEIRDLGVRVIGISPDQPEVIAAMIAETELDYSLLSDSDAAAAIAFGIAFRVDDETIEKYKGYGINLDTASGHDHHLLPVPSVYLVDKTGTIRFAHWNPDYKQRLSADELIAAAKEITGQ